MSTDATWYQQVPGTVVPTVQCKPVYSKTPILLGPTSNTTLHRIPTFVRTKSRSRARACAELEAASALRVAAILRARGRLSPRAMGHDQPTTVLIIQLPCEGANRV